MTRSAFATAFAIATNDLRRRLRDRSAIIQAFLAPTALALVISLAFGGTAAVDVTVGLVDLDHSPLSIQTTDQLTDQLTAGDRLAITPVDDIDQATGHIDDGDLDAAIVIPAGFEQAATRGARPRLEVLADPARPIGGDIAEAVAQGIAGRVDAARLATALNPGNPREAAELAATTPPPISVTDAPVGSSYDAGSYFAPSMAILFLFLTLGSGARSLLTERKEGTLTRLRSMPIAPRAIIAGKTLAVFALGLASFLTVYAVTAVAFDAEWGPPGAVVTVIVATTAAVAALSVLVTSLARTDAQAEGYTSVLAFGLALLGGNFVTPGAAPDLLRTLSRLTPNGWSLTAFTELAAGQANLADIATTIAVLTVITLAAGGLGLALTDKQMTR
ncbi:MAG: ABC transporter permease [Acidimicrobiales bacterium]